MESPDKQLPRKKRKKSITGTKLKAHGRGEDGQGKV